MSLQYIVPLHQMTAKLHTAVGGLSHLVTIDETQPRLASRKQNILVRNISQYLEYHGQKCGVWGGQGRPK